MKTVQLKLKELTRREQRQAFFYSVKAVEGEANYEAFEKLCEITLTGSTFVKDGVEIQIENIDDLSDDDFKVLSLQAMSQATDLGAQKKRTLK